jgi:hypothetical protein
MLPLESLAEGVVVFGPERLVVRPLRCRITARRKLWGMVQVFRALSYDGACSRTHSLHNNKMLLSQFMLLPSLYLQATGRFVSKRGSFALVRDELPSLPWDIMDAASELRADWTQPRFGRPWQRLAGVIGPWEAQALWRRLSLAHRRGSAVPRAADAWIDRMVEFAETLLAAAESANQEEGAK